MIVMASTVVAMVSNLVACECHESCELDELDELPEHSGTAKPLRQHGSHTRFATKILRVHFCHGFGSSHQCVRTPQMKPLGVQLLVVMMMMMMTMMMTMTMMVMILGKSTSKMGGT